MDIEFVALIAIILHSIFIISKVYLTSKYAPQAATANKYPFKIALFQSTHAMLLVLPYIWFSGILDLGFLTFQLPWYIKWLGILDYLLVLVIMIWQMKSLSVNISAVHEDRFLVITGPYSYVRHPLYSLFIFMQFDLLIITGNLIFTLAILPAYIASKIRADFEETQLIDEYGQEYKDYMVQTGQLFPKLSKI